MTLNKYITIVPFLFLFGCGTSDSNNLVTSKSRNLDAYLIGANTISGISYTCSNNISIMSKTKSTGLLTYPDTCGTLIFKIGSIELSRINIGDIQNDKKIYITDLIGLNRTDTNNIKVSNISRILQSLDSDSNSHNGIDVNSTIFNNITNVYNKSIKDFTNELNLESILVDAGISTDKLISVNYALVHLEQKLRKDNIYVDTQIPFKPSLYISDFTLEDTNKILIKEENSITMIATANNNIKFKLYAEANTHIFLDTNDTFKTIPDLYNMHSYYNNFSIDTNDSSGTFYEFNITTKDDSTNVYIESDVLRLRVLKDLNPPLFDINNIYEYNTSVNSNYIVDVNISDLDINTIYPSNIYPDGNAMIVYDIVSSNKNLFDINSTGVLSFKNTPTSGSEHNITIRITDFARHTTQKDFNITVN